MAPNQVIHGAAYIRELNARRMRDTIVRLMPTGSATVRVDQGVAP